MGLFPFIIPVMETAEKTIYSLSDQQIPYQYARCKMGQKKYT
jgi:hypothetical protein